MQELTLEEIHAAELYTLKEVDKLCRELKIKYWVAFGTLIGAVREHGFIPWDDDLDIVMKRDDYEIFLNYFFTHKHDTLELNHPLNNKDYTYYIARVSEKNNRLVFEDTKYTSGVFIDIYPMDGLEGVQWKNSARKQFTGKCCCLFQPLSFKTIKSFYNQSISKIDERERERNHIYGNLSRGLFF